MKPTEDFTAADFFLFRNYRLFDVIQILTTSSDFSS